MDRRRLLAQLLADAPASPTGTFLPAEPADARGTTVMQAPRGEVAPLDTSDPTARLALRLGMGQTVPQTAEMYRQADMASNFAGTTPMRGVQGVRAYHGSPHDFDRFDMRRIGTGEGAQAYGHGLYFAESEGVARSYRDALRWQGTDWNDPNYVAGFWLNQLGNDPTRAIRYLEGSLVSAAKYQPPETRAAVSGAIDLLRRGGTGAMTANPGRMYEVNLRVDPNRLLDWDAPLSQQAPEVREALRRVPWGDAYVNSSLTGGQIMPRTADGAQQLREAGIPGIRYLDGGSRAAGDGTRNYVMFDDSLIEILRKYGLAGLGVGLGAGAATQAEAADARP